ncbi:MAG: hypothetical protein IJR99_14885 [Kiritimatiellae bacterium]|nr:hypothetical protein [Kiritimatiellia bacterium]
MKATKRFATAAKYGADVTGTHRGAFLLDIAPATPIPEDAALLKVVDFRFTAANLYIEVGSDVTEFEEKGTRVPMPGNGFLSLRIAMSLSTGALPPEIRNGRAVIDMPFGEECSSLPSSLFMEAVLTDRFQTHIR